MQPHKTEQGRLALQSHAAPLNTRERRALILCDGQRDLSALSLLLGQDASALVMRLHEAGYLAAKASAVVVPSLPQAPATPLPAQAPAEATGTRRSLIGAKLYLVGILELQRDEAAAAHRRRLLACHEPEELIVQLLAAIRCLQQVASTSLACRVRDRLGEVLPESLLPSLERLERDHAGAVARRSPGG